MLFYFIVQKVYNIKNVKTEVGHDMKKQINKWINTFITEYRNRPEVTTDWGDPIVGFAAADSPYIQKLPELISSTHGLPQQVMADARLVIAYYVPFTRALAVSNNTGTEYASEQWALAYEQTNEMFGRLNSYIIDRLTECGYKGAVHPAAGTFDHRNLISDWSFRHFAYAAGLGTFGLNNMLITPKGCCGRYNTIITNLDAEPDRPMQQELCLYKRNKSCGICMRNCPAKAITESDYDRHKCYEVLSRNAKLYKTASCSYEGSSGSEVCGKCVTGSPCAFWNM